MHLTRASRRAVALAIGSLASLTLLAGPAAAGTNSFTSHEQVDPTGAVFTCPGGNLTVTGGTLDQVFHFNADHNGHYHVTGTAVPHDATLVDGAGNVYTISGASWFGGTFADTEGEQPIVVTSTDHFVIHDPSGGVFATVRLTEHLSPNGHVVELDGGDCQAPQD